jgi:hypothetical protein
LAEAARTLDGVDDAGLPPALAAVAGLARAELALRQLRSRVAAAALDEAAQAASRAGIPALIAEVAEARSALARVAARRLSRDGAQSLALPDVEAVLASGAMVLDACRRGVAAAGAWLPLARRPILFSLASSLGRAWPEDVERDALIVSAFRTRHHDETHRARLRVEIGRLRALLQPMAALEATPRGFVLRPRTANEVVVLAPPIEGEQAAVLALLSDGAAWSTSALAMALDASQRTVQRAIAGLEAEGQVHATGQARARRWLARPLVDFTTVLLLPASLPGA